MNENASAAAELPSVSEPAMQGVAANQWALINFLARNSGLFCNILLSGKHNTYFWIHIIGGTTDSICCLLHGRGAKFDVRPLRKRSRYLIRWRMATARHYSPAVDEQPRRRTGSLSNSTIHRIIVSLPTSSGRRHRCRRFHLACTTLSNKRARLSSDER